MKTPEQWVDDERLAFDDDVIDCDRKEVEVVIRKAQAEAYAAGQEAQHRKTWAFAMAMAAEHLRAKREPYRIMWDVAADEVKALHCPPIEATKDK